MNTTSNNVRLLTTDNAKTKKGESKGFLTYVLYLAPHKQGGLGNVCPHASPGCILACLFSAGMGKFANVRNSRIRKTQLFFSNPREFIELLSLEIEKAIIQAKKKGLVPCFRLNATSDLPWELLGGKLAFNLFNRFPNVAFYDYTKNAARAELFARGGMPSNYHLTFSRSECNESDCKRLLGLGVNIATVFSTKKKDQLPATYQGVNVIDGDLNDLRFTDPKGVYVGLRAKGQALSDKSGFVIKL